MHIYFERQKEGSIPYRIQGLASAVWKEQAKDEKGQRTRGKFKEAIREISEKENPLQLESHKDFLFQHLNVILRDRLQAGKKVAYSFQQGMSEKEKEFIRSHILQTCKDSKVNQNQFIEVELH